eukprot:180028_1
MIETAPRMLTSDIEDDDTSDKNDDTFTASFRRICHQIFETGLRTQSDCNTNESTDSNEDNNRNRTTQMLHQTQMTLNPLQIKCQRCMIHHKLRMMRLKRVRRVNANQNKLKPKLKLERIMTRNIHKHEHPQTCAIFR